jgi:hypothetical protein
LKFARLSRRYRKDCGTGDDLAFRHFSSRSRSMNTAKSLVFAGCLAAGSVASVALAAEPAVQPPKPIVLQPAASPAPAPAVAPTATMPPPAAAPRAAETSGAKPAARKSRAGTKKGSSKGKKKSTKKASGKHKASKAKTKRTPQ